MNRVDQLYDLLAAGTGAVCDRILGAALGAAEPPYFERIVGILLDRADVASWAGLIAQYERLPAAVRDRLQSERNLMNAGIADAAQSPSRSARCNALAALADDPEPRLAYLLPELLRDHLPRVREAAAAALRATAAHSLDQLRPSENDPQREEYEKGRTEVVTALSEVLRTYHLHHRPEALEPCLWFAREISAPLWDALGATRSTIAYVVSNHLATWNDPRLAAFLLQALPRPEWRPAARRMLSAWKTLDEFAALLRNNDLLEDAEIRRFLRVIHRPPWFDSAGFGLLRLPRELRAFAPRWLLCVGLKPPEQAAYLRRWSKSPCAVVQRATAEALETLEAPRGGVQATRGRV